MTTDIFYFIGIVTLHVAIRLNVFLKLTRVCWWRIMITIIIAIIIIAIVVAITSMSMHVFVIVIIITIMFL
jgi:hypothetical protein